MVISPAGQVLAELPAGAVGTLAVQVDPGTVANWYLSQQRRDVLDLRYRPA